LFILHVLLAIAIATTVAIPIAGFANKNIAFAQSNNNCNNNVVGACVATGSILSHNKVQAGVYAQVLASNGLSYHRYSIISQQLAFFFFR
jgi:putative flippase GtrA